MVCSVFSVTFSEIKMEEDLNKWEVPISRILVQNRKVEYACFFLYFVMVALHNENSVDEWWKQARVSSVWELLMEH